MPTLAEALDMLSQFINSCGFPCACVAVMFWMQNEERKAHAAESAEWVKALNRNSTIMHALAAKMGVEILDE